jgi:hypothetical protein
VGSGERVQIGSEKTFDHASLTVGATAVALASSPSVLKRGVQIKAAAANTGKVYVGNSDVTADTAAATDGFELSAGQGLFVPANDLKNVYVIASAAAQKIFYLTL